MAKDTPLGRITKQLRRAFGSKVQDEAMEQAAALVWRRAGKKKVEVLLVTSRGTGRWVLPKGWIEGGESTADAAIREAWEEAGVEGEITADPFGTYAYGKIEADGSVIPCHVTVYALEMTRQARNWPEQGERTRKWVSAAKASSLVEEDGLAALLDAFGTDWKKLAA